MRVRANACSRSPDLAARSAFRFTRTVAHVRRTLAHKHTHTSASRGRIPADRGEKTRRAHIKMCVCTLRCDHFNNFITQHHRYKFISPLHCGWSGNNWTFYTAYGRPGSSNNINALSSCSLKPVGARKRTWIAKTHALRLELLMTLDVWFQNN